MARTECTWTTTYGHKSTDIRLSVHKNIQFFFSCVCMELVDLNLCSLRSDNNVELDYCFFFFFNIICTENKEVLQSWYD